MEAENKGEDRDQELRYQKVVGMDGAASGCCGKDGMVMEYIHFFGDLSYTHSTTHG